jgi:site-specific DNA-methyltransferase (adenine-specific)
MGQWKLNNQDIRKWVENQENRFHAVLTDPPYNLDTIKKRFGKKGSAPAKHGRDGAFARVGKGFMGKEWDTDVAFDPNLWHSIGKLLYPGAFGLAFISRNYHKLAMAIEEAGFIIHPIIGWIQSQGFPKATKIDTQVDKRIGVYDQRNVVGRVQSSPVKRVAMHDGWKHNPEVTGAVSALGKAWEGWRYGLQSLKPAMEPIIMFQKPYENKPVDDITRYGAGALNIEGTKFESGREIVTNRFKDGMKPFGNGAGHAYEGSVNTKLYPANVIIDEGVGEPFSNFFYQAKANQKERNAGLDEKNEHPTIKPIDLIKYLATLLLPPDQYAPRRLLVPFSGAGSEMIGSLLAGWDYVEGVEIEKPSYEMAIKRINHWMENGKES